MVLKRFLWWISDGWQQSLCHYFLGEVESESALSCASSIDLKNAVEMTLQFWRQAVEIDSFCPFLQCSPLEAASWEALLSGLACCKGNPRTPGREGASVEEHGGTGPSVRPSWFCQWRAPVRWLTLAETMWSRRAVQPSHAVLINLQNH